MTGKVSVRCTADAMPQTCSGTPKFTPFLGSNNPTTACCPVREQHWACTQLYAVSEPQPCACKCSAKYHTANQAATIIMLQPDSVQLELTPQSTVKMYMEDSYRCRCTSVHACVHACVHVRADLALTITLYGCTSIRRLAATCLVGDRCM